MAITYNVGSMDVEYTVSVDQAVKQLEKYNKIIEKTAKKQEKATKKEKKTSKIQQITEKVIGKERAAGLLKFKFGLTAAAAAIGIVVGGLYALIKASSYGSIYMSQMQAIMQQLADTIMEQTGLTDVVEDALEGAQEVIDTIQTVGEEKGPGVGIVAGIMEGGSELRQWVHDNILTPFGDADRELKLFHENIEKYGLTEALKISAFNFCDWFKDNILWLFPSGSAAWILFIDTLSNTDLTPITDKIKKISDCVNTKLIDPAKQWAIILIDNFKTGLDEKIELIRSYLPDNVNEAINKFISSEAFQLGVRVAKTILSGLMSIPLSVTVTVKKIFSNVFSRGNSGGGSWESDMNHPWDQPGFVSPSSGEDQLAAMESYQFGGNVNETGINLLHKGEYVVPKGGVLMSTGSNGGDTYNIAPVINITQSGSNSDLSRQISSAIASEIKRIVKV